MSSLHDKLRAVPSARRLVERLFATFVFAICVPSCVDSDATSSTTSAPAVAANVPPDFFYVPEGASDVRYQRINLPRGYSQEVTTYHSIELFLAQQIVQRNLGLMEIVPAKDKTAITIKIPVATGSKS